MADERRVTMQNYRKSNIDDLVRDFYYIFRAKDKERSLLDIWMHAVEHASRLAEEIRRERYDRVEQELAGVFAWVASFIANCGTKQEPAERILKLNYPLLSDIIWNKYPKRCPVCENPECACLVRLEEVEKRSQKEADRLKRERKARIAARARKTRARKIRSIIALEEMFYGIFKRNIFAFPIENIGFHLLEEIGEVSIAITGAYTYILRKKGKEPRADELQARIESLEEEVADVLSWLFSLSCKLREMFKSVDRYVALRVLEGPMSVTLAPYIYLADSIMHGYSKGGRGGKLECRRCHTAPCECRVYFVNTKERADRLVSRR